jgi:serine/threonine-protein kinase ULK4
MTTMSTTTQSERPVIGRTQPTQMKVPHKTIDQLLIHQSDTAVKPIVGNKEIERITDEPLNPAFLSFKPWSSDEVVERINSTQIESHLSDVYNSIASHTTINEKISTLQYFESIIVNSNVSNSLINSAFMALLKKMLEQIKSPMIKIRVCSVVGLLIRHSTIIDNDLAEIDIATQLIDTLRDSNEIVRRRAIAALGEYMFYAAT